MISTRREAMAGLGALLALGGRVEAAPTLDVGFEGKQISAGENRPGLPMGSTNDALLAYLHLRLPADQLAGKLKLSAMEVERRTDALVQEGLARRLPDGQVRPTALVVTRAEQPRFLYAQPDVVRATADAIGTMLLDVRRRYAALPVLGSADDAGLDAMAAAFAPMLLAVLERHRPALEAQYRSSPYVAEGVSFPKYFIWWYHVFYTDVTNELARRGMIVMPRNGTLTYLVTN